MSIVITDPRNNPYYDGGVRPGDFPPDSLYYSPEFIRNHSLWVRLDRGTDSTYGLNVDTTAYTSIGYWPTYSYRIDTPPPPPPWWRVHGGEIALAIFAAFVLVMLLRERRVSVEEGGQGWPSSPS